MKSSVSGKGIYNTEYKRQHVGMDKFCKKCQKTQTLESFYKDKSKKDGLSTTCKKCRKKQMAEYRSKPEIAEKARRRARKWHQDNKEYARKYRQERYDPEKRLKKLLSRYDLTLEEYNTLSQKQNGCCAICGTTKGSKNGGRLVVDHCHESGNIRGLLCHSCNRGLGMFRDKPELLKKALKYLEY